MLESGHLYGMRIITTDRITKDVQARTHRKKRINKKWLKRYGMKTIRDDTRAYMANGTVFMTWKCYQNLKKHIDNGGNAEDFMRFQNVYEELMGKGGAK